MLWSKSMKWNVFTSDTEIVCLKSKREVYKFGIELCNICSSVFEYCIWLLRSDWVKILSQVHCW